MEGERMGGGGGGRQWEGERRGVEGMDEVDGARKLGVLGEGEIGVGRGWGRGGWEGLRSWVDGMRAVGGWVRGGGGGWEGVSNSGSSA